VTQALRPTVCIAVCLAALLGGASRSSGQVLEPATPQQTPTPPPAYAAAETPRPPPRIVSAREAGRAQARARRTAVRAERQRARDRFRPTVSIGAGALYVRFVHPEYAYRDFASGVGPIVAVGFRRHFHRFGSFQGRLELAAGHYLYAGQYPEPLEGGQVGTRAEATVRLSLYPFYLGAGPSLGVVSLVDFLTRPVLGAVGEIGFLMGPLEEIDLGFRLLWSNSAVTFAPTLTYAF